MDGTYKMSAQYFRTLHWIDIKLSTMVSVRIYYPCPSSQNFSNFFCLLSIVTFPFPEWSPRELIFSWYFIHEYPVICSVLSFPSVHMVSPKLRKAFKTKRCVGICQERWEKVSFIKLGLIYFSFMHFVRSCRSVAPGLMDNMPSIRIVSGWELQTYSLFFFSIKVEDGSIRLHLL